MTRQVRNLLIVCGLFLLLVVGVGIVFTVINPPKPKLTPAELQQRAAEEAAKRLLKIETKDVSQAKSLLAVALPTKKNRPAPTVAASLFKEPLRSHEVWNFLQYFDLGSVNLAELSASSAVIYSGVCVSSTGSIDASPGECGDETTALQSPAFVAFVSAAHASGDAVLLSLNAFDDTTIAPLVANAAQNASTLAAAVLPIVTADGLNGVNLDIEGSNPAESTGFVAFVSAFVVDILRCTRPRAACEPDLRRGLPTGQLGLLLAERADRKLEPRLLRRPDSGPVREGGAVERTGARRSLLRARLHYGQLPSRIRGSDRISDPGHLQRGRRHSAKDPLGSGFDDPVFDLPLSWEVASAVVRRPCVDCAQGGACDQARRGGSWRVVAWNGERLDRDVDRDDRRDPAAEDSDLVLGTHRRRWAEVSWRLLR